MNTIVAQIAFNQVVLFSGLFCKHLPHAWFKRRDLMGSSAFSGMIKSILREKSRFRRRKRASSWSSLCFFKCCISEKRPLETDFPRLCQIITN